MYDNNRIFVTVMDNCKIPGTLFQSKPYRFLVQNGDYVTVETEWTSFVNPWTKKLEIIINHHRVIQVGHNSQLLSNKLLTLLYLCYTGS